MNKQLWLKLMSFSSFLLIIKTDSSSACFDGCTIIMLGYPALTWSRCFLKRRERLDSCAGVWCFRTPPCVPLPILNFVVRGEVGRIGECCKSPLLSTNLILYFFFPTLSLSSYHGLCHAPPSDTNYVWPCHPIWQHSSFSDPALLPFKRQVNIIALECSSMLTLICLATHFSNNVCLCTLDFKPRFGYKNFFFACSSFLLLLPLVITLLPHCHSFLLHDDKLTNERADERLNGNSSLLMSCSSFAYHY
jgi:hypothetical protein